MIKSIFFVVAMLFSLSFGSCNGVAAETQPNSAFVASSCSGRVIVNLTVVLSGEISAGKTNLLIELRQGTVGHSRVVGVEHFRGTTGTVAFGGVCAGSYFLDIGNSETVAVTPVHSFGGFGTSVHNITVSLSSGNVHQMQRKNI